MGKDCEHRGCKGEECAQTGAGEEAAHLVLACLAGRLKKTEPVLAVQPPVFLLLERWLFSRRGMCGVE